MTAEAAYVAMLVTIFCAVLAAVVFDLLAATHGEQMISEWLRQHPRYFFLPVSALLLGLVALTVCIFVPG